MRDQAVEIVLRQSSALPNLVDLHSRFEEPEFSSAPRRILEGCHLAPRVCLDEILTNALPSGVQRAEPMLRLSRSVDCSQLIPLECLLVVARASIALLKHLAELKLRDTTSVFCKLDHYLIPN